MHGARPLYAHPKTHMHRGRDPWASKHTKGRAATTYGYRFMYHGVLHKEMLGARRHRCDGQDAEQKERARLAMDAFEGSWGR